MNRHGHALLASSLLAAVPLGEACRANAAENGERIALPAPRGSDASLDAVLRARRSVREFALDAGLTADQLSALLFAAQGITDDAGRRTAPSAGALYPLEVHVLTRDGAFRYEPGRHALVRTTPVDRRAALARAAHDQAWLADAPAVFVLTSVTSRTAAKYGSRAERYATLEAGHAAENLLLEATALGLAGAPIGAFDDGAVRNVLGVSRDESPLYVLPVGVPASR